ncbi:MAG: transposase [Holosporaceae bacterium]|nr:transposase [Holosporaceae bacterium]
MSNLVLGVDVSKKELSLALLKNEKFFAKTVLNSAAGFKDILKFISQKSDEKPEVYMEATGSYSEPVAES